MKMLQHKFVEFIPDHIDNGILYISIQYCTAIHKCPCSCGNEVVTPLSPIHWRLIFDGKTVSLYPSIGNWNLNCHSHYWIKKSKVEYAYNWSQKDVNVNWEDNAQGKSNSYSNSQQSKAGELLKIGFLEKLMKIVKSVNNAFPFNKRRAFDREKD